MRSPSPDVFSDMATESTQPQTQPQTLQEEPIVVHPDCWGLLIPSTTAQPTGIIQLRKKPLGTVPVYGARPAFEEHTFLIGRSSSNDCVLPGQKISSQHCKLVWSGRAGDSPAKDNAVVVHDNSSNGTFINGKRIGKTKKSLLAPGDELSFALPGQELDELDYRYIFRRPTDSQSIGAGVFKDYEMGPALGRGAFATVRRALHRGSGQWYACKVITKSRMAHNPRGRQMFEREVAIMKEFDHPHICKLIAHYEDEATIYLILELITGGDLLEAVINEDGLGEAETQRLATEMCLAMEYSHSKGITHRDLKPENVLLTETEGEPRRAKIADFGLAKAVDNGTFLKTFCGTPTYLAPEVVLRAQDAGYNELVDSWSLGVIVWSMLTNTVPFTEEDEDDMVTRFQRRQVDWSQVSSFGLSNECIDWMQRMVVADPAHRMNLAQALDHPWLARVAKESGVPRPPRRERTLTPEAGGSTAGNSSVSTSLVSTVPPTSQEAQALDRCSQSMSSMVIDGEGTETASALGSASLVSGAVSVVSGFTATTHTSDASNLGLVSRFSDDSFTVPGGFPNSQPQARALPRLNQYETPEMLNVLQVPGAPLRPGRQAPPVADDSMQTDSSWDQVSQRVGGENTVHPQLQEHLTPSPHGFAASPHTPVLGQGGAAQPDTPNGYLDANGRQPPHLEFNQTPMARQVFQAPHKVVPSHPGPMREPLPVAPSSPVVSTPTSTSESSEKQNGAEHQGSSSDLSEAEDEDLAHGPTGTVRQKRTTGAAPTRASSRIRTRLAQADDTVQVRMPINSVGARRSNRRHTPFKQKIH